MRTVFVLALALVCLVCRVAAAPYPCPDFRACIQLIEQLEEDVASCERHRLGPVCPRATCDPSGIPWGHLSTVLGLVVVCVFGISAAAKYRSKMREERHTVSTTMLGGGFMARLGVRRAATTHRFRDVATETETAVRGHVMATVAPDADAVAALLASAAATTTIDMREADEEDAAAAEFHDARDEDAAPAATIAPRGRFCSII